MSTDVTGWAYPNCAPATKAHFFWDAARGESLCGRWMILAPDPTLFQLDPKGWRRCAKCTQLLAGVSP